MSHRKALHAALIKASLNRHAQRSCHHRNPRLKGETWGTRQKHFYRFGALGSPDIVCVVNGQYVGIEVKAPKGRQSEHQKEFQRQLEAAGGRYILAYSIDEVIAAL